MTRIADPESHELNQAWVEFDSWVPKTTIKVGRQAFDLNNQRYLGGVRWRQNMQTFDAATVRAKPTDEVELLYGYFDHVDRIFGSGDPADPSQTEFNGGSHVVSGSYDGLPFGKVTAFALMLDLTNAAGSDRSNHSYGAILEGTLFAEPFSYRAEYGYQTDAFDSTLDYAAHYLHLSASAESGPARLTLGHERLGSDNGTGYQFPTGTNHPFNGYADLFGKTPAAGLGDTYLRLSADLTEATSAAIDYHYFGAADGGGTLGHEVDLVLTHDLGGGFSALSKGAYFVSADPAYPDTQRFAIQLEYKY